MVSPDPCHQLLAIVDLNSMYWTTGAELYIINAAALLHARTYL